MSATTNSRSGWIAVFLTICIWTGFILVSRHGGTGTLTSWDIASLRFGVGAVIAVFFLPRVSLPPLRVVALFSLSGGIGYAIAVYAAFRMTPAAHAAVLLPGALPFLTMIIAWLWLGHKPAPSRRAALVVVPGGDHSDCRRLFFPRAATHWQADFWRSAFSIWLICRGRFFRCC